MAIPVGEILPAPINIAMGQVSAVDNMSPAPSSVINWQRDVSTILRPRPGLVNYAVTGLTASPIIGLFPWGLHLIVVTEDRRIWAIHESAPTVALALSDAADPLTLLDGSSRPTFAEDISDLFILGGGYPTKWSGVGLCTRLTTAFTGTHITQLGQRLVANDLSAPGRRRWSNLGDAGDSTWDVLATDVAEARPDPVVAVHENTAEIFTFGTSTIEVASVTEDPSAPFGRISTVNVGLSAPYSVIRYEDSFAFLDDKRRFVLSDGRSYEDLSPAIVTDLRSLSTISDCWGYREEIGQHSYLVWVFPAEGRCFAFSPTTKEWRERNKYTDPTQGGMPIASYAYWPALNLHLTGSATTGALYELDRDTRSDLGDALVCDLVTGWHTHGTEDRKRSHRIRVSLRRGTETVGVTPGQLEVRVQDDGEGWGDWEYIDIGNEGDYAQHVDLFIAGIFRRRRYQFRYSGSSETSFVSAVDMVSVCQS